MANQQPAELAEPCVGAFDDPASLIAPELPAVFVFSLLVVVSVRDDEVDAALGQPLPERVGVVGAVGDHALGLLPRPAFGTWDFDFGERGFRKRNFSRRGTFEPNSSGRPPPSTSTIHFVPLPRLVFPTAEPPFWPGRSCRPGTSLPTSAGPRRPARPAAPATLRATRLALPTASDAASRSPARGICRVRTSTRRRSAIPKGCPRNSPGWKPTDVRACLGAVSARAVAERSTPTAHHSTTRIASCSCKKKIKPHASQGSR